MSTITRIVAIFVLLVSGTGFVQAQTPAFQKFTWHVATSGNARVDVIHSSEGVQIAIGGTGGKLGSLSMSAEQAIGLGNLLA